MQEKSTQQRLDEMPEVFVSTISITRGVSRAAKAGNLRKIASRLYTHNLSETPEALVRRNLWQIVGDFFPGALIADRTALENVPAEDGSVCLVSDFGRTILLPGITIRPRRGIPPLATDRPFIAGLYLSSVARAFVENMHESRTRNGLVRRTLSRKEIEERLEKLIRQYGEGDVKRLRDEIRRTGKVLGMKDQAKELDKLIGALLGTRKARLSAPTAIARQAGKPFDPERMELFHRLHAALRNHPPQIRIAQKRKPKEKATLAFFEAYFTNFIEGTEFSVTEAEKIVFRGDIPEGRHADAQDVLGTWQLVSDDREMSRSAKDFSDWVRLLKLRHASIMQGRPDKRPGGFKQNANRAGTTVFVAPSLVLGTLEQGYMLGQNLESAFQRAVFMKFLVSEVHPFVDGNGRVARVMMNAELVAAKEERIVIPTVYRANYLTAVIAFSQSGRTGPLIRMLDYAQRWTAAVDWRTVKKTERELEGCNAFLDAWVAEREGLGLRMPDETAMNP